MSLIPPSAALLPWLADFTLLATLWLGIVWLGLRCLPRLAAARRHLLLSAALACIPVLMLGALRVPTWNLPVVVRAEAKAEPVAAAAVDPFAPTVVPLPAAVAAVSATGTPFDLSWREGLLLLWLAGIGAGLTAMLVTARRLRQLRHGSARVRDGQMLAHWRQACAEAGVRHDVAALLTHPACEVPMTWGLRRPVVLLPDSAADWPDERLRIVLRHELAHLTRQDVLVAVVTGLMALPLWFHPLVWLLWRDAHEAREAACDDAALIRSGDDADVFAAQLLDAVTTTASGGPARRLLPMALCMAARSAEALKRRLAAILENGRPRSTWPRWQAGGLVAALLTGALAVSGLSACRTTGAAATMAKQQVIIFSKVLSVPMKSKTGRILATAFEGTSLDGAAARGLQLRGILDEKQAEELLKKLDEAKDEVRILSTPTVTTRNGQRATVEVGRDFIYPTEFEPPTRQKDGLITPTTPTAFESRQVGVRIDFVPQVGEGGIIDLETTPQITQFLGFLDYGSPISSEVTGPDGKVTKTLVTPNKIQQPIFHSMKTQTSVTLRDGQYLIIGGLAEEEGQALKPGKPDYEKVAPLTEGKLNRLIYFIIQARLNK